MSPAGGSGRARARGGPPSSPPPAAAAAAAPPTFYEEIVNSAHGNLAMVTGLLRESEQAAKDVFKAIKAKELAAEVRPCR